MTSIADDPRIDPRIKQTIGALPAQTLPEFETREELLAFVQSPEVVAMRQLASAFYDMIDNDSVAPSAGLDVSTHEFVSSPDGNTIKIRFIRPQSAEPLPCVVYLHGGGMAFLSAFDGLYRVWGRVLANQGVAVAMIDFRNSAIPSSAPEVEPYPAGLNDCVSGLDHLVDHASELGIDPSHLIVAGESGGGNLTLALGMRLKQEGRLERVRGLYALCPFIAGSWPQDRFPSSVENNGILLDLHSGAVSLAYGPSSWRLGTPWHGPRSRPPTTSPVSLRR